MDNQLLLLEDVVALGRKGDLVKSKPGYARNYLFPQKKAVIANPQTLKMRKKLQEERQRQAHVDRADAEKLAERIKDLILTTEVKVDLVGNMYGSVTAGDIAHLLQKEGYAIEKRHVVLPKPLKKLGKHQITLKLNEGVPASCEMMIKGEGIVEVEPVKPLVEVVEAPEEEKEKE